MTDHCPYQWRGGDPGKTCVNRKQNGGPMSISMAETLHNMPRQKKMADQIPIKWRNPGTCVNIKQNGGPMSKSMAETTCTTCLNNFKISFLYNMYTLLLLFHNLYMLLLFKLCVPVCLAGGDGVGPRPWGGCAPSPHPLHQPNTINQSMWRWGRTSSLRGMRSFPSSSSST